MSEHTASVEKKKKKKEKSAGLSVFEVITPPPYCGLQIMLNLPGPARVNTDWMTVE